MFLKQSTAVDLPIGPFADSTDGDTAETALTLTQPDIRLKKNGAAWAQKSAAQTLSHEENGYYEVSLSTTDTDTIGHLRLVVHEGGALIVDERFFVVSAIAYAFLTTGVLGLDSIPSDALQTSAYVALGAYLTGAFFDADTADHDTADTMGAAIGDAATAAVDIEAAVAAVDSAIAALPSLADVQNLLAGVVGTSPGGGAAAALVLESSASSSNDTYNSWVAVLIAGTGAIQAQVAEDYVGSTRTLSFPSNWDTPPDATTQYVIFPVAS